MSKQQEFVDTQLKAHDQKEKLISRIDKETGGVAKEFKGIPSHTRESDPKEIHLFLEALVSTLCSHQMHHLRSIKVHFTI